MRKDRSYRISITSNDKEILESIRNIMGSTHPINKDKRYRCWTIYIYSKYLYKALIELGGLRCKSKVMVFPLVPKKYLRDFIRGYFDGDGSVFFVTYARTKDKKLQKS